MEPIEILKKFKSIRPDADYAKKSRMVILSHGKNQDFRFGLSVKDLMAGVLRSGWSMALTAVLLLLTISGFSALKFLSPATTAVVDLTGLKAEAQDIDIQIQVANVAYDSSLGIENKTSTQAIVFPKRKIRAANLNQLENQIKVVGSETIETSIETDIDSILNALSK